MRGIFYDFEFIEGEQFILVMIMNKTSQKRQLKFGSFRPR